MITREAAETLVPFCRSVTRPVDDQLDRFWEHGIPSLCLFPFPLIEEARPSMIGNDRFVATETSLKRKALLLRELSGRRLAILRRRRHRQDWTAVRFAGATGG